MELVIYNMTSFSAWITIYAGVDNSIFSAFCLSANSNTTVNLTSVFDSIRAEVKSDATTCQDPTQYDTSTTYSGNTLNPVFVLYQGSDNFYWDLYQNMTVTTLNSTTNAVWITVYDAISNNILDSGCSLPNGTWGWTSGNYQYGQSVIVRGEVKSSTANCDNENDIGDQRSEPGAVLLETLFTLTGSDGNYSWSYTAS